MMAWFRARWPIDREGGVQCNPSLILSDLTDGFAISCTSGAQGGSILFIRGGGSGG